MLGGRSVIAGGLMVLVEVFEMGGEEIDANSADGLYWKSLSFSDGRGAVAGPTGP